MNARRAMVLSIFALAIGAVYLAADRFLSLDALAEQDERLRNLVARAPVASWLCALAIYIVVTLVPGTGGKALIVGWLFPLVPALLIVNLGLTCAALASFTVVRYVFQSAAHRRFGPLVAKIDAALAEEGATYLLALRLLHAPYTILNYAAAATTVRTRTFWWTTQVGMLPGNLVFVLGGASVPSLRELIDEGPWSLINFPLLLALSLAGLVPVAVRIALRKHRARADVP